MIGGNQVAGSAEFFAMLSQSCDRMYVSHSKEETAALRKKITHLNKEIGRLKECEAHVQRLSQEKNNAESDEEQVEHEKLTIKGEVFTLTGETAALRGELHKLQDDLSDSRTDHAEVLRRVTASTTVKDAEITRLRRDLETEKSGNCTDSLHEELHRTLGFLDNEKANDFIHLHREIRRLRAQLTSEKKANRKSLEKDLAVLQNELKFGADRYRTNDLAQQVAQLQLDLGKESVANRAWREQYHEHELRAERHPGRNQLETQTRNDHTVALSQQVDPLRTDLEDRTAADRELRTQQVECERTAQATASQYQSLQSEFDSLRAQFENHVKTNKATSLRQQIEKLQGPNEGDQRQ
ncbi:hypothetical protein EPUS_09359 [Endocarpon pusillum Z07020]|uniref:Uncharacterized protein n=1 Tax=Endocarpon pusillum (strain Z07020 / HMAS-L-300199) TaxID=1263415 RepID=U1GP92_ENDPU|nr:uncharacterized protein EPUS_09359 [Endocarpon pusillum Z07020]ERF73761.1 hypothetical protein EPUS_09359 [Endocarpon pusillum Z07020]